MPQIAEMKEIDGDLWVRIGRHQMANGTAITLYTESEIRALKAGAVQNALRAAEESLEGQ